MESRPKKKTKHSYHHGNLRRALIGKALKLIEQRKDVAFTIREIASQTGVTHTAAYRHFADKRALLSAIAEEGFRLLAEEFNTALHRTTHQDRAIQLHALGMAYIRFALKNPGHFRAMFHSDLAQKDSFPALQQASKEAFSPLRLTIENGIKEEVFRGPAFDVSALAAWSLVHGFALLALEQHIPRHGQAPVVTEDQLASDIIRLFQEGLLKK